MTLKTSPALLRPEVSAAAARDWFGFLVEARGLVCAPVQTDQSNNAASTIT